MIIRIGINLREPYDFLAVNDFSVNDRADFSVASAGIETYPATVEMTADGKRAFLLLREIFLVAHNDFERLFVNSFHKVFIERSDTLIGISSLYEFINVFIAGKINFIAAHEPENGFHDSFRHKVVFVLMTVREYFIFVNIIIAVVSLDADF